MIRQFLLAFRAAPWSSGVLQIPELKEGLGRSLASASIRTTIDVPLARLCSNFVWIVGHSETGHLGFGL